MKKIKYILATLALAITLAACDKTPVTDTENADRTIVYAVDAIEARQELTSDAEWDAMLDHFCNYAQEGHSVTFFNIAIPSPSSTAKSAPDKETLTFSTTDRAEMKAWMKAREKEGRTVNVTYDSGSGTWNGTAYATAPHPEASSDCYSGTVTLVDMPDLEGRTPYMQVMALQTSPDSTLLIAIAGTLLTVEEGEVVLTDGAEVTLCGLLSTETDRQGNPFLVLDLSYPAQGSIIGTWAVTSLLQTEFTSSLDITSTLYLPGDEPLIYELQDNGTAVLSGSGEQTRYGTWSISDEGQLCCDLLIGGGGCWDIKWLTDETLIITKTALDASGHLVDYQVEMHAL